MCTNHFISPSFKRLTTALLMALFVARAAHAATYYVATTGNDANAGTSTVPWRTVAKAVSTMVAGDTTYVRGGTYNEGVIYFKRSGTQAAQIKLLNYPGESPVISCNPSTPGTGPFNRIILQHASGPNVAVGWITIEGFEITKCWDGIKVQSANDITIQRNWIHDNQPGQGILGSGARILINRNIITHNGNFGNCTVGTGTSNDCNQDHGIYMNGANITITNNLIYNSLGYGIQINGNATYDATKCASSDHCVTRNWRIANNTFAYQKYRSAIIVWSSVRTSTFENNICYENAVELATNSSQCISFQSPNANTFINIRNNLSYASGSGGLQFIDSSATEGVHYTQSGNVVGNPLFVNGGSNALPTSPNFALTSGSPAINRGLNLYADGVRTDFSGAARPQTGAFDIGAYEYGGSTPPLAFNFDLSNGGNKSVTQGSSVTNSLTASLVSGTAQAVSLSVSGLPSGVTASFSPASCTPNCSSTLTLNASASAATGSASVTVTATGGGVSNTSAFTLTVNAAAPPPPPPSTGPVGWWKLDENTGTAAADSSGSGNNGTLTNGPTWTAGRLGAALAFDGINDNVTIPHSTSLALTGAFSMAAWVNPAISTTNFKSVMVKNYTHFFYASSKGYCGNGAVLVGFVGSAGTKTACDPNPLPANAWTHLAATSDGSVLRLYRNGVLTSSAAVTGVPVTSTGTLQLGASRFGEYFNGKLDEARVYNRALSAAEVLALFNAAPPSATVTDLNGDGVTNITDIQISVNQAAGAAACTTGDVNKDGVCNVADVQLVTNKTLGL
jgi:hypothetical protein